MKTLPDSPSLEHLRRQAKDLHRRLKADRADAALSDAQALVAQQYGYRTWADLKAEVDRRSAHVKAGDPATTAALCRAFDLGEPGGPMTAYERQWSGQAWVIETDRGRWLARRLFEWFEEAALEDEATLADAAAAAGIVTMRLVRTASGSIIERIGDARWRLYDLPPLGPEATTPADPRQAAAAGRVIGQVHAMRIKTDKPVQPWLTAYRSEEQWRRLAEYAAADGQPWAERLSEAVPTLVDVTTLVEPVDRAGPPVLSACFYAPNAFRVVGRHDVAIDSWEHAGAMPPRWDVGGALVGWGADNPAAARALLDGYAEHADVPPVDIGMFSAEICARLNWLATRVQIAVNDESEPEYREIAGRTVQNLLIDPVSRQMLERVLAGLGA